jgi:hypothetical protein
MQLEMAAAGIDALAAEAVDDELERLRVPGTVDVLAKGLFDNFELGFTDRHMSSFCLVFNWAILGPSISHP